jgi:hypothetical protein
MSTESMASVRMFGALHKLCRERGLEPTTEMEIPEGGCSAWELACRLDLPLAKIEAVFVNHRVYGLGQPVQAGDRVAFVPIGIPSPERVMLGIYRANRQNGR